MTAARLLALDGARLTLGAGRHAYETQARAAIDASWRERSGANPRLYDGEALLFGPRRLEGGVLIADGARIRYAGLLHFLAVEPAPPDLSHIYCCAALIGCDGRATMARMARHTANAGRVYFPSGSLEAADFRDGVADLRANMAREVMEETGIDLARAAGAPGLLCWESGRIAALFQVFRFAETAQALAGEIAAHLASGADDELDAPVVLEPGQTLAEMPASHRAFMAWLAGEWAAAAIDD